MPSFGSQADYARHRGVSEATIRYWRGKGLVSLHLGLIDFERSDQMVDDAGMSPRPPKEGEAPSAYRNKYRPKGNSPPDTESPDLDEEAVERVYVTGDAPHTLVEAQRVKENYLALLRKLEYEKEAGTLVNAETIKRRIFDIFRRERDSWINWPSRISAVLAAELGCDPVKLTVLMEREVRKHLEERSDITL